MAINYPSSLDGTSQFPQPSGTNLLITPDHALSHTNISLLGTLVENIIGVTPGTNIIGQFIDATGEFAPAVNSSMVFQDVIGGGTANAMTLGSVVLQAPTINGQGTNSETISGGVYGTSTMTGGTAIGYQDTYHTLGSVA